jgi:hypothetical protein
MPTLSGNGSTSQARPVFYLHPWRQDALLNECYCEQVSIIDGHLCNTRTMKEYACVVCWDIVLYRIRYHVHTRSPFRLKIDLKLTRHNALGSYLLQCSSHHTT